MAKKKQAVPPVLIISGGQELLRRRFLRKMTTTKEKEGYRLDRIDGSDRVALGDVLGGGFLVSEKVLAVVDNPGKADLALLQEHAKEKDPQTVLLLYLTGDPDGRTKFGKWANKEMDDNHKRFPLPKTWDAPKVAAQFVVKEALSHGMMMPDDLSRALVQRVGSDLGMLVFEVQKICLLGSAAQVKTLGAEQIKGAMAPIAEASVFPISDALAIRNKTRLVKALMRVRATSKYDPTMQVSRFLGASVHLWIRAVYLDSLPPRAAAEELGLNAWYFETKVLPSAKRWGKVGTVRLASALAASERAVLSGAVSPWNVLSARLLALC